MKLIKQKKKIEKSKPQKEPPKNIQFNNNEVYSLNDIGSCVSSLIINNCPIFSLTGLKNFESVKTFQAKNALIFSFKDINPLRKVENISFEGCPITRYPFYRLMVLLLFSNNDNKLKTIDSEIITDDEKAQIKSCLNKFSILSNAESTLLQTYLKNGGIIRSDKDLLPEVIRKRISPNIVLPPNTKEGPPNSLLFSPFFTKKSIQKEVNSKADQIALISVEKKLCDYQNEIRSCQLEIDDIFSRLDLLNSNTPISPLFEQIRKIQEKVDCSIKEIQNIELPPDVSKDLQSANDFLNAITSILKKYQCVDEELKKYLTNLFKNYQDSITILTSSHISAFCQDYLDISKKIINVIGDIINSPNFSIDFAVSNISKISEIESSFTSPYIKIIDKIFDLSTNLLKCFNNNQSIKSNVVTLYQKVSLYKKMPLLLNFDLILEQIAVIQSCFDGNQDGEGTKILSEISDLCQNSLDEKVFNVYANNTSTDSIIKCIEENRKSLALNAISFWKTTQYTCQFPTIQKLNESILERTNNVGRYIKEFEEHIKQNKIVTTYIKDRIFDSSNDTAHNIYNSSMLKMKSEEIKQKNAQIEKLKELIAKKKSG